MMVAMSAKVNLTLRIKSNGKDRFVPVVFSGNGRVKPGYALVDGKEEHHPLARYYLDWTEDGTRRRSGAGSNAPQALAQQIRKEVELDAISKGIALAPEEGAQKRLDIRVAYADYLSEVILTKKHKTINAYSNSSVYFLESLSTSKRYMDQLERKDMLNFSHFLKTKMKQSPRSVWNKFNNVMTFLKWAGVRGLVHKNDWPTFVEEEPEVYDKDDLDDLYANCTEEEKLWWDFFLMTGMREQEVIYMEWTNLLSSASVVQMRWKSHYNWKPKGYKEREIPIPHTLRDRLDAVRPEGSQKKLMFPTSGGAPKLDFLDRLKKCAARASRDEEDFWLHKFRATFATWHLQAGIDVRTVQLWMGHKDLEYTLRYLRPARGAGVQVRVNATFA